MLIDGSSHIAHAVARCLRRAHGVRLSVLSTGHSKNMERFSDVRFHIGSHATSDADAWIAAIEDVASRDGVDVLIAADDEASALLVRHRNRIERIAPTVISPAADAFEIARHKGRLMRFLRQHDIPRPRTVWMDWTRPLEDRLFRELSFPVLYKVCIGAGGGRSIRRFESLEALLDHLRGIAPAKPDALVQEFIAGTPYAANVLCRDGMLEAYSIHRTVIRERGPYSPAIGVRFETPRAVLEVTEALFGALNWSGVANADILLDPSDGSARVVEVNARYWQNVEHSVAAGVNFPVMACEQALGMALSRRRPRSVDYIPIGTLLKRLGRGQFRGIPWNLFRLRTGLLNRLCDIPTYLRRWRNAPGRDQRARSDG